MTINENTRTILHEMGLNAYEIDTYITLLDGGKMTAMEISEKAQVPYSKIYEVLNSLKEKGWIKSGENRPTKYYPVPPLEATRFIKLQLEDKYAVWENMVTEELQPLYLSNCNLKTNMQFGKTWLLKSSNHFMSKKKLLNVPKC